MLPGPPPVTVKPLVSIVPETVSVPAVEKICVLEPACRLPLQRLLPLTLLSAPLLAGPVPLRTDVPEAVTVMLPCGLTCATASTGGGAGVGLPPTVGPP